MTTETEKTLVRHWVPVENLEALRTKFATLCRRAVRLALAAPEMTVTGVTRVEKHEVAMWDGGEQVLRKVSVREAEVMVTDEEVRLSGWEFVAALEFTSGGVIVRSVNEVPEGYRTTQPFCEHCGIKRSRGKCYVVRHEDGRYMQVGSGCLSAFLGNASADKLAGRASYLKLLEETFGGCGMARVPETVELPEYFAHVAQSITDRGWVPRANATTEKWSTAEDAWHRIYVPKGQRFVPASPEAKAVAEDVVKWATDVLPASVKSDYEHNLLVIARQGFATQRQSGLAASMVTAYYRHLGAELERRGRLNEHYGTVGKREDLVLTLTNIVNIGGEFDSQLLCFVDERGRAFVWKTATAVRVDGEHVDIRGVYEVRATVKRHDKFTPRGATESRNQTVLTRLTFIRQVGTRAGAKFSGAPVIPATVAQAPVDAPAETVAQAPVDAPAPVAETVAQAPVDAPVAQVGAPGGKGACRVLWDMMHRVGGVSVAEAHEALLQLPGEDRRPEAKTRALLKDAARRWPAQGRAAISTSTDPLRGGTVWTATPVT